MKVSEAIDRLEVGDTVWVKATVNAINFEGGYIRAENTKTSIYLDGDAEISLTEPQADKVEVTEEQAELLRAFKGESIYELLTNCLVEDEELMAKARLFGYTVKPKRWVVKLPETGKYFANISYGKMFGMIAEISEREAKDAYPFTDRAKAEAVATLVEGTVEEA